MPTINRTRCGIGVVAAVVLVVALIAQGALVGTLVDAAEGDKLDLKLRLKKGDVYNVGFVIDQDIKQILPGQPKAQNLKQKIGMGYRMEVTEVDAEGTTLLRTVYDSVRFRQEGPAGVVEYDSRQPPERVPPIALGFAALPGQTFTIVMTPAGKVAEVRGVNEMLQSIMKRAQMPDGPAQEAMLKMMKEQFGEQAMKEQMQNLFGFYPESPVAVGESWSQEVKISMGFPMVLNNTYTLESRDGGVARIAVESRLSSNPEAKPLEVGPMTMTYALTGSQTGTTHIDEASGWATDATLTQQITGDMTMTTSGNAQKVPMAIKSDIAVESKKSAPGDAEPDPAPAPDPAAAPAGEEK